MKCNNDNNLIIQEISQQKNNEFNFSNKNDDLLSKNVIYYKRRFK